MIAMTALFKASAALCGASMLLVVMEYFSLVPSGFRHPRCFERGLLGACRLGPAVRYDAGLSLAVLMRTPDGFPCAGKPGEIACARIWFH